MRTNWRSGGRALGLAVLALVVSLSERAQAQQSGLFPLAPIRRERTPCAMEDPIYKTYKQQYFGYHPTCWRPFPAGWGCPSPEAPNKEKSFREQPLGRTPELGEGEPGFGPEGAAPGPGPGGVVPGIPNVPEDRRSPFEMDNPAPGVNPLPRGTPAPRTAPPGNRSPFEDLNPGASVPSRRPPRVGTAGPSRANDAPDLAPPAAQPEQDAAARGSGAGSDDETLARGDDGPLLPIDDIDVSRSANVGTLFDSDPIQPAAPASASPVASKPPAPRRGLISSLFGGLGMNWFRR
jgi:hypothetical protein